MVSSQPHSIYPVLPCGGSGTRLWPLSRALYPKQLLQFESEEPLLLQTARRVEGEGFAAPLIVCNEEHRLLIATLFQRAALAPARSVLEFESRNTAPAAAVAALCALDGATPEDDPLLLLPSDHNVPDKTAFQNCVRHAVGAAHAGRIVTFGNGYGRA